MSAPATTARGSARAWDLALAALAVALVLARVLKAHATGIVFDEAMSFLTFGRPSVALTSYEYPNNHVLNSLLIAASHALLSGYEHGIRLHSVLAGAAFTVAVALLARELLARPWLRLLALALVGANAFLFDLSFLARGYALALAATTLGLVPLVRWCRTGLPWRARWRLPALLVGANVVTLGSMVSAAPFVAAWNLVVALGVAPRVLRDAPPRARVRLRVLAAVALPSALLLHLLYRRLYGPILAWPRDFQMRPTAKFLRQLLVLPLAERGDLPAGLALAALVLLAVAGAVVVLRSRRRAGPDAPDAWRPLDPLALLVPTLLAAAALLAVQRGLFQVSLGFPRNESFLLPWAWLAGLVLVDRLLASASPAPGRALALVAAAALATLVLRDLPSPRVVEIARFETQSVGGPLLRELARLDPGRTWRVRPTEDTRYLTLVFEHYRRFGRKVESTLDPADEVDVTVGTLVAPGGPPPYFREDLFDAFSCRVRLLDDAAASRR